MTGPRSPDLTLAHFAAQVPAMAGGNTPWAARYARELREIVVRQAHRQPRNVQRELGPSELGHPCHRQVVGKMVGVSPTNHVADPWPSIVGTAVHAWFAEKFLLENRINGVIRWVPEHRVAANALLEHPGTADLYDGHTYSLVDHKILGPTSMAKVQSPAGPPWHYIVQMLIYAQGYRDLGARVDRVVLAAWPRTAPTLDAMYCWERPYEPARDDAILQQVRALTAVRRQVADQVLTRQIPIEAVPRTPSEDCFWCPQFRPQSALDGGPGCPGHSAPA
jgi:hypothetical protein